MIAQLNRPKRQRQHTSANVKRIPNNTFLYSHAQEDYQWKEFRLQVDACWKGRVEEYKVTRCLLLAEDGGEYVEELDGVWDGVSGRVFVHRDNVGDCMVLIDDDKKVRCTQLLLTDMLRFSSQSGTSSFKL